MYYIGLGIFFFILLVFAGVATFMIGKSQKNQEGDPSYDMNTNRKWLRLTLIYTVLFLISFIILGVYTYYHIK